MLQDGVVYDYVFDAEAEAWVNWLETPAGREEIPRGAAYHDIVVPTMDTVRARFFVDACAKAGTPLLISGTIPSVLLSRRFSAAVPSSVSFHPFPPFLPPVSPPFPHHSPRTVWDGQDDGNSVDDFAPLSAVDLRSDLCDLFGWHHRDLHPGGL